MEVEYSKLKIAQKIIIAANHAINNGCIFHLWQWGIVWDKNKKCFTTGCVDNNLTWGSLLASVILYFNYTAEFPKEKIEVAAEVLGVEIEWVKGFLNGLDGRYNKEVDKISQRKTTKGKLCRDGVEIGTLLKIGYLVEEIARGTYQPCSRKNYNTHNWTQIEENKTLTSMGVIQQIKIYTCKECNMYGCSFFDNYHKYDIFYISKTLVGDHYYKNGDFFNYNECKEEALHFYKTNKLI